MSSDSESTLNDKELNNLFEHDSLEKNVGNRALDLEKGEEAPKQDDGLDNSEKSGMISTGSDLLEDKRNSFSNEENSCATGSIEDDIELPSKVTDKKEIFIPLDLKPNDPRIYGKWLWFSNGNLHFQDYAWIGLSRLILSGEVILIESSTAKTCYDRDANQGVIKCYTRGDKMSIKQAGVAIQKIINDGTILYYKSNESSNKSLYRRNGDSFITEYMLTTSGKFYERDMLDRWAQVCDSEEKSIDCQIPEVYVPPQNLYPDLLGTKTLPSQELKKKRYFYPLHASLKEADEKWSFFCDIADFDSSGMTELDRAWEETKKLYDEGHLLSTSCETFAHTIFPRNLPKRMVSCLIGNHCTIDQIVKSGDILRSRISYNRPMYVKICFLDERRKLKEKAKYMYTEDGNLYEFFDHMWRLVREAT